MQLVKKKTDAPASLIVSQKRNRRTTNIMYAIMAIPALLSIFIWKIIPMFGIVIAFEDYNYVDGFFSPWVGLANMKAVFQGKDFWKILRNTLSYNIAILLITSTTMAVVMAILLYSVKSKKATKLYHTAMITPGFISYVIIAYIVYTFLNPTSGLLNTMFGLDIRWYEESKYWPVILVLVNLWRDVGMASLYFYAALLAIDSQLFEAAKLDGAGRLQTIWHIAIPEVMPMVCTILILRCGSLLGGDMGLYYQVPMANVFPALLETTDVFSTYVYRGIEGGAFDITAAVGVFNSVTGLVLLLITNSIIRKVDKDKAIF